jgi:hypothetical protein
MHLRDISSFIFHTVPQRYSILFDISNFRVFLAFFLGAEMTFARLAK